MLKKIQGLASGLTPPHRRSPEKRLMLESPVPGWKQAHCDRKTAKEFVTVEKSATILIKAAAIILENRSLLMCRKRGESFYITPGGKVEPGETLEQALARELKEELNIQLENCNFFATFDGPHATKADVTVRLETYFAVSSDIPQASGEIEEIRWVKSNYAAEGLSLSQISAEYVIPALLSQNLID